MQERAVPGKARMEGRILSTQHHVASANTWISFLFNGKSQRVWSKEFHILIYAFEEIKLDFQVENDAQGDRVQIGKWQREVSQTWGWKWTVA